MMKHDVIPNTSTVHVADSAVGPRNLEAWYSAHPETDDRPRRRLNAAILAADDGEFLQNLIDAAHSPGLILAAKRAARYLHGDWRLTLADILAGELRRGRQGAC